MRPPYWKEMILSLSVSSFLYIGVLWGSYVDPMGDLWGAYGGPMGSIGVCLGHGIDEASLLEGDEFELVDKCMQGCIKNL